MAVLLLDRWETAQNLTDQGDSEIFLNRSGSGISWRGQVSGSANERI